MEVKKGKRKIVHFLVNVGTSGKYKETKTFGRSDYLIRYWLMNFIIVSGMIILLAFIADNIGRGRIFTPLVCSGMILMGVISFILARTKISQLVPSVLLLASYGLMCILITSINESEGANVLFIYVYPLLTIMLLGMRMGAIFSSVLIALISLQMFVPDLSQFEYNGEFTVRILVNYFLVFSVMVVIEITRKTKDRLIEAQNKQLNELNTQLLAANERLTTLSVTDELTKLNNRRSFLEYMEIIWKQSHRLNLPLTVMMIDIDYFKKYNDSLGHLEGDKTLIAIAQCMKNQLKRETDFIARFGGEEFICLLPYTEESEAVSFANKLVQSVEDLQIPHPMSEVSKYVTISAGIACAVPGENNNWEQLLDEADKTMYKAKEQGRNRVAINTGA